MRWARGANGRAPQVVILRPAILPALGRRGPRRGGRFGAPGTLQLLRRAAAHRHPAAALQQPRGARLARAAGRLRVDACRVRLRRISDGPHACCGYALRDAPHVPAHSALIFLLARTGLRGRYGRP